MGNKEKIVALIVENSQQSVKQLSEALDISLSMTHRHIRSLLADGKITKIGSAPRVFYIIKPQAEISHGGIDDSSVNQKSKDIINQNFLYISAHGERIDGWKGFVLWCDKRKFNIVQRSEEYVRVYKKYATYKNDSVISGKEKVSDTFKSALCLEDVFYADFYAWEIFGKTKLGQLLLYAKQSQNRKMIKELAHMIKPVVQKLITLKNIDAVGFIPPSVKRQVQFMRVFQESLTLALPVVRIVKVQTEVVIPQKTLSKLHDRIENADSTMVVPDRGQYKNVLLIDDALGSGATLNQVACKVISAGVAGRVYGFTVTGSAKGFDVISEV